MELWRKKNTATIITFPIVKKDGSYISGASGLDSEIEAWDDSTAPDGFTDCTNEATEIGSTGIYYLSLTQAEMNADYIAVQIKSSSTDALVQTVLINTTRRYVDVRQILGADVNTASAQIGANVVSQANIDFGATQKASIQAAVLADRGASNTELSAIPASTAGWGAMVQFLFEYFRNKRSETIDTETLYKEDASTALGTRTLSDDGTTFTRGEMG